MTSRSAIAAALAESRRRGSCPPRSTSFLSDADWQEARMLLDEGGDDTLRLEQFCQAHLLDLIQECDRLYEIVRLLGDEREAPQPSPVRLKLAVRAPA